MLEHITNPSTNDTTSDNLQPFPDIIELPELAKRVRQLQSADPDPYGLHRLPLDLRMIYIEHFLLTGYYLI